MNFMNRISLFIISCILCFHLASANANTGAPEINSPLSSIVLSPIALTSGGASVAPGQQFCINITATDFDSIVAMQYTMTWDTAVIQFDNFSLVDLPDPFNFGSNVLPQGAMTFSWNASQDTTNMNDPFESVPDGTVLYELCFTAIGEIGECTDLSFVGVPAAIEVISENGGSVGLIANNGTICIIEPINLASADILEVNCGNAGQGTIDLEFTGGTQPFTFEWDGPNMFSAATEDLTGLDNGIYYLTITDNSMIPITYLDTFEVVGNFAVSIANAGVDTNLNCYNNGLVELNGSVDPDNSDIFYQWFTTDGNIVNGEFTLAPEINQTGTYYLETMNQFTFCKDTSAVIVTDGTIPPIADAGQINELNCFQSMINLNGTGSAQGTLMEYSWTTTDGNILNGDSTLMPLIDMPGTYVLNVFNGATGCSNTSTVLITQDSALPTAIAGEDTTLTCLITEIILDGIGSTTGANFSYSWITDNGGTIQNASTLSPTVDEPGTYFLIVTDDVNMCSDTSMVLVDLMETPPTPIDAGPPATITCDAFVVLLDGTNSIQGPNYEYLWTTNDGSISEGETTLTAVAEDCGTYYLEVTNLDDGCTNIDSVVVVCDTIKPIINFVPEPAITCAEPIATIDASGSTSGPDFTYLWNSAFGNIVGGLGTQVITADEEGVYGLLLEDTTTGCFALKTIFLSLDTIAPNASAGDPLTIECGDPLSLDGSGSTTGDTISYLWTTINGSILMDETTLMPLIDAGGEYIIFVTNTLNGCMATDTVLIDGAAPLESAALEAESAICGTELLVTGNLPFASSGVWTSSNPSDFFENPMLDTTFVMDLDPGVHTFVWTLSTIDCPDYDSDSLDVFVEGTPDAVFDEIELSGYVTDHMIQVLENDDTTTVQGWTLDLVNVPDSLTISNIGSGFLDLSFPAGYFGNPSFEYALCAINCPDQCDTTTVFLNITEPLDTITTLPNGITPNGDGVNDEFIIPELSMNPELYPNNEFIVFNRWGDVVYSAKPYNNDWSGTTSSGNKDLPQGTYYYVIRLDIGSGEVYKGDVTILR